MKKFIVLYHATDDAMREMAESTADPSEGMKPWMEWAAKCGDQLVDLGNPLMGGKRLSPDGSNSDSSYGVAGYSILEAESMEEAMKLMDGHPHLKWNAGCTIEVHESMPLPG